MVSVESLPELFSDLTPIPQDDGENPVCVIAYPQKFTIAHDYMRAVWKANELSERSLKLTALCLKLNPANYTVWHFRRQCLQKVMRNDNDNGDGDNDTTKTVVEMIRNDLDLAASLGGDNPKNYQIWYHRRALLESSNESLQELCDDELVYISDVLEEDGKNYHAWSHRQWVIKTRNDPQIWTQELDYVKQLIKDDPRNNSAWNQRWFASHYGNLEPLSLEKAKREADYAIQGATFDPFNESPFRYLIAILKEQLPDHSGLLQTYETKIFNLRDVVEQAQKDPETCVNLTSARIDLLELMGDNNSLSMALKLAEGLATNYDIIRKKYWELRIDEMKQKIDTGAT